MPPVRVPLFVLLLLLALSLVFLPREVSLLLKIVLWLKAILQHQHQHSQTHLPQPTPTPTQQLSPTNTYTRKPSSLATSFGLTPNTSPSQPRIQTTSPTASRASTVAHCDPSSTSRPSVSFLLPPTMDRDASRKRFMDSWTYKTTGAPTRPQPRLERLLRRWIRGRGLFAMCREGGTHSLCTRLLRLRLPFCL